MLDYLKIGGIISTHGLKGEVKVYPTTEDVRRYDDLDTVYIEMPQGRLPVHVERVRYFKNLVIVKFRGLDRIEDVESLARCRLCVMRRDAAPLEENEYYIADLIGLSVEDEEGRDLGTLTDVLSTGANDVYVVKGPEREILIPAIRDCILSVDLPAGKMRVHLLAGL